MLETPFVHEKGTLEVPTGPGLGITISPRALKKWKCFFMIISLVFFALRDRGVKASRE